MAFNRILSTIAIIILIIHHSNSLSPDSDVTEQTVDETQTSHSINNIDTLALNNQVISSIEPPTNDSQTQSTTTEGVTVPPDFIDSTRNISETEIASNAIDTVITNVVENATDTNEKSLITATETKLPPDCSQREKMKTQPNQDNNSRLRKCCPLGESLSFVRENQSAELCVSSDVQLEVNIIHAVLYDNCIEDAEIEVTLPTEIGNPCNQEFFANSSLLYNNIDDRFYVLQDGSLLVMDEYANDSYNRERHYCLDVDLSGTTYAIVCITSVEERLERAEIVTVAVVMLVSIPCLLLVSYLHLYLKQLRTLHGLSLAIMSLCLAIGFFLHSLMHILNSYPSAFGYIVQFFILSYFFWFFCLCNNVVLNVWLKIPQNKWRTRNFGVFNFAVYFVISFFGPLGLVIATLSKGFPGMPSYFIQGFTESIRDSQRYFIPPITTLLIFSFIEMIISFFGFQRIEKQKDGNNYTNINAEFDRAKYEEIKKDAKCITLLLIIMCTTWISEIVTFYSPDSKRFFLIIMEIINALQGVLILVIFLIVRRRRTIILRWWYDRGTHNIEDVELKVMNKEQNNN